MKHLARVVGLVAAVICSQGAHAKVITESDTGIIFAPSNCRIISAEVLDLQLRPDNFDYLNAVVTWSYDCQVRGGRVWTYRESDSVFFPGLEYNMFDSTWYWGDYPVARRTSWRSVELLGEYFASMWSNIDEGIAVSYRSRIELPDADPDTN